MSNNGTSIPANKQFTNSKTIYKVEFGNTCKTIEDGVEGGGVFENCCNLSIINEKNKLDYIGNRAFFGTKISDVKFNCVTTIGNSAFENCTSLKKISINTSCSSIGNYAFKGCSSLTSFVIPTGVKTIMNYTFSGCSRLTSIIIHSDVENIGDFAFYECTGLKTVYNFSKYLTFSKGSTDYGHIAYYADKVYNVPNGWSIEGDFIFGKPNGVNTLLYYLGNATELTLPADYNGEKYAIGANVFNGNTTIRNVTIGDGVTSIGSFAFYECSSLTSVVIPNSVTSIGGYAFYRCSDLISIEIPNSVTSIGIGAFAYCTSLTSIEIPNSVTSIGKEAFKGCSEITSIVVDDYNTKYDSRENCNAIIETETNTLILGCKNTTIPETVTEIGEWAFYGCYGLTEMAIPDSVTKIGGSAFYGCSNLNSIEIPEKVTDIGGHAFCNCNISNVTFNAVECKNMGNENYPVFKNLDISGNISPTNVSSVTIGNNVTTIPAYAFYNCSKITKIAIPNKVTSIGKYAFFNCKGITSVIVGNSITSTSIGEKAFYECTNNKTVYNYSSLNIEAGKDNYGYIGFYADNIYNYNGTNIGDYIFNVSDNKNILVKYIGNETELNLPESYDGKDYIIGENSFANNSNITKVNINNNINEIGNSAFEGCTGLKNITNTVTSQLPTNLSLGDKSFYNCNNLNTFDTQNFYIHNIGESTFEGCEKLEYLHAPSLNSIGQKAFCGCTKFLGNYTNVLGNKILKLTPVALYNISINDSTFQNCTSMNIVELNANIGTICKSAFEGCTGIETVTIDTSSNLETIGENAFKDCTKLKTFNINDLNNLTTIGKSAFENCKLYDLKLTLSNNTTTIGDYCFKNSGIQELNVESTSISIIPKGLCEDCKNLTRIDLSNSIEEICEYAFKNCVNLTKNINNYTNFSNHITIPSSVRKIGNEAFYGCKQLLSILFLTNELSDEPFLGDKSFSTNTSLCIYIPNNVIPTVQTNYIFSPSPSGIYVNSVDSFRKNDFWKKYSLNIHPYKSMEEYINNTYVNDNKLYVTLNNTIPDKWIGATIFFDLGLGDVRSSITIQQDETNYNVPLLTKPSTGNGSLDNGGEDFETILPVYVKIDFISHRIYIPFNKRNLLL